METEGSLPPSQQPATRPYPSHNNPVTSHPIFARPILIISSHTNYYRGRHFVTKFQFCTFSTINPTAVHYNIIAFIENKCLATSSSTRVILRNVQTCSEVLPASYSMDRGQLKCNGTRAGTRFRLSAKRTSPFKSAGGVSSVYYWQPRCAHQR